MATEDEEPVLDEEAPAAEEVPAAEGEGETQQQEDGLVEGGEASGAASGEAVAPLSSSTVESFSPSWDPYSNDVWRMRTQSLERFVRAARNWEGALRQRWRRAPAPSTSRRSCACRAP